MIHLSFKHGKEVRITLHIRIYIHSQWSQSWVIWSLNSVGFFFFFFWHVFPHFSRSMFHFFAGCLACILSECISLSEFLFGSVFPLFAPVAVGVYANPFAEPVHTTNTRMGHLLPCPCEAPGWVPVKCVTQVWLECNGAPAVCDGREAADQSSARGRHSAGCLTDRWTRSCASLTCSQTMAGGDKASQMLFKAFLFDCWY